MFDALAQRIFFIRLRLAEIVRPELPELPDIDPERER
jgi:hypothetical protein